MKPNPKPPKLTKAQQQFNDTFGDLSKYDGVLCIAQSTEMSVQAFIKPGPYDLMIVCSIPNGSVTVNITPETDYKFEVNQYNIATICLVRRYTTNSNRYF